VRPHDVESGPYLDGRPDILIEWDTSRPVYMVESPRLGRITRDFTHVRTGAHLTDAMFLARGPQLRSGQLDRPLSIMDFAPTVALRHGVTPPPRYEGRPVLELCAESTRATVTPG
jgi:hypothetical protein